MKLKRMVKLYKKYSSKKDLEDAVNNKEVDIYFDYYGINNKSYEATLSTFIEDYVVLGNSKDNYIVNSFESLKDKDIVMLSDNSLYNYFENKLLIEMYMINIIRLNLVNILYFIWIQ